MIKHLASLFYYFSIDAPFWGLSTLKKELAIRSGFEYSTQSGHLKQERVISLVSLFLPHMCLIHTLVPLNVHDF